MEGPGIEPATFWVVSQNTLTNTPPGHTYRVLHKTRILRQKYTFTDNKQWCQWRCTKDLTVLWHCWLGGRKGIRPVKNRVVGCWRGYLSGARCRLADLAQLMSLPLTVSCFSKIQIGFTFLVPAHLGNPGKRAVKRVCVCVWSHWEKLWNNGQWVRVNPDSHEK